MSDPVSDPHASHPRAASPSGGAALRRLAARLQTRPHTRLAALGIVGAVMIVLPLVQVLRYQNAELQALMVERASLDPVNQAVEVQRGLIAHRDLAGQVLRGEAALEPERQLRQGQVDERVALLTVALAGGPWEPARHESDALRADWAVLAGQVAARRIDAAESDQSHRLLTEQALQVIDLLGDAVPPRTGRSGDGSAAWLAGARAVPRLAGQLEMLAAPAPAHDAGARQRDLVAAEAAVARTLGALDAALDSAPDHRDGAPPPPAPRSGPALADASAVAGATAERLFQQLRADIAQGSHTPGSSTRTAAAAALRAQFTLFTVVHRAAADALAERTATAQHRRRLLLWTMAALTLLALALAAHLLQALHALQRAAAQPLRRHDDQPEDPAATRPAAPGSRVLASRLLDRLRLGGLGRRTGRAEPQTLLPPER